MNPPPIIQVQNLWFTYNGNPVLQGIDLEVNKGDFVAMIGPNGGGKTTLLKIMLGLLKTAKGTVKVFGRPPKAARHRIGYVPQEVPARQAFPVSVLDVVLMGRLKPGVGWTHHSMQSRKAAQQALDQMGMGAFGRRSIGELSGGQRQRVMIARALVTQPDLMLLDEPTASIDTKGRREFYQLLKDLNQKMTIVVVSHEVMVLSTYVKSITCVNHKLHYHDYSKMGSQIMDSICPCSVEEVCPVELMTQNLQQLDAKTSGEP